ncbi:hypothetical protein ABZ128_25000 [Streptomyces sp. NPDC006326]|uniref:hypothetical protein n=1 Tax=Streptomyces sp. NPDC006326 TaxID=3156752 RepID=UPI0033ADE3E8
MARVTVEGGELVVRLSLRESLAARRREVRVPLSSLRRVEVESSWWRVLRGVPGHGSWRPGRCLGVRHAPGGDDFVAVKAQGPVLCMELAGEGALRRVAVSVPDARRLCEELSAFLPAEEEGKEEGGGRPAPPPPHRPLLQHEGGTADDHGRRPGAPSRTGTGAQPPADDERVREANQGADGGPAEDRGGAEHGARDRTGETGGGVRPPSQP